jgi:hypothetical protein
VPGLTIVFVPFLKYSSELRVFGRAVVRVKGELPNRLINTFSSAILRRNPASSRSCLLNLGDASTSDKIAGALPIQLLGGSRPTLARRLLLWGLVFRVRQERFTLWRV